MKHADNSDNIRLPRDIVVLSHLRWGFVYQRPQHLLTRFARNHNVFFVEEPIFEEGAPRIDLYACPESGVKIVVPCIAPSLGQSSQQTIQKLLLSNFLAENGISDYLLWYYTPMALSFSRHFEPRITVFDCMDELSAFKNAPQEMKDNEAELMRRADIVFTGGQSLYEAKLGRHDNLYCFPSSIDYSHFAQARSIAHDTPDQAPIPRPRIGFAGVIDERMDLALLAGAVRLRPDWHFVMVGPVVKIDQAALPQAPNIHWLGGKSYNELPAYVAGWDVAMMPFAHNESTRFISPTKTPEYLAAGKPVVSTSITDVVRPYAVDKVVRIADTPEEFVAAIDACMNIDARSDEWQARVDGLLAQNSWDLTWQRMCSAIGDRLIAKQAVMTAITTQTRLPTIALGD